MKNDNIFLGVILVSLLAVGMTVGVLAGKRMGISGVKVDSGKQFIYDNATYKCEKTNELKED